MPSMDIKQRNILSIFSLSARAGKLVSGESVCEAELQKGNAKLVIISADASSNTIQKFTNKAFYYKVPSIVYGNKEDLSRSIGKSNRTTFVVTDVNFANKLMSLLEVG